MSAPTTPDAMMATPPNAICPYTSSASSSAAAPVAAGTPIRTDRAAASAAAGAEAPPRLASRALPGVAARATATRGGRRPTPPPPDAERPGGASPARGATYAAMPGRVPGGAGGGREAGGGEGDGGGEGGMGGRRWVGEENRPDAQRWGAGGALCGHGHGRVGLGVWRHGDVCLRQRVGALRARSPGSQKSKHPQPALARQREQQRGMAQIMIRDPRREAGEMECHRSTL